LFAQNISHDHHTQTYTKNIRSTLGLYSSYSTPFFLFMMAAVTKKINFSPGKKRKDTTSKLQKDTFQ